VEGTREILVYSKYKTLPFDKEQTVVFEKYKVRPSIKIVYAFTVFAMFTTCPADLIILNQILGQDHEAAHYVIFSFLLSLHVF
jgi:hypothetical protein